ncbi:MAG: ParB N-terminal domain-containing protein [Rhodospirillaceae bacterium]|nr:ParB N-terminal domain-containing protein [Rhodospirillaceae bacterium]
MKALGLQEIDVALIDVGPRLRPVNEAYVAVLAANIGQQKRLRQPIDVRVGKSGRYRLIAGAHRLAAVTQIEWSKISAFVYEANDDEARMAEIDENIVRHELNPLDRAMFLAERKKIYERLHPEVKKGAQGGRGGQRNESDIVSFSKETAARVGLSERAVQRAVSIANGLTVETRKAIAGTSFALKQAELIALAKLTAPQQQKVVRLLLADNAKFRSVRQAADSVAGRTAKPVDGFARLVTVYRHATAAERRQFRAWLTKEGELSTGKKEAA